MEEAPFPILEFDPAREALIEPARLIKPRDVPQHCVICFFREVIEKVSADPQARVVVHSRWEDGPHPIYEIVHNDRRLAFFHPGIGGALAAGLLEVAIAYGCRKFIVCGGFLVLSSSAGQVPGTAGSKTNFGFNVKYNKSGTNLQGHVNIIVRSGGHVYQIKATSLSSLGVAGIAANFSSKANITDITDPLHPISLEGNATLQLWMTDNGEPGTSDTLGIQVLSKSGGMWFSSNWSGTKTVEQTLGGGNLSVH